MPASYSDPLCELKGTHYKVSAGIANLKDAIETDKPDRRVSCHSTTAGGV